MNVTKFNHLMDYIETHLMEEIPEKIYQKL